MSKICIVGCGFVGLTVGAALKQRGYQVIGVDSNPARVESLRRGDVPFHEPGLQMAIRSGSDAHRFEFSDEIPFDADAYVVCVGTPLGADRKLDCSAVESSVASIVAVKPHAFIAIKSTVMPGTCRRIDQAVAAKLKDNPGDVGTPLICFWPETLREGSAVNDFANQATIIGTSADGVSVRSFWSSLWMKVFGVIPTRIVSFESAEMFKLALNGYLAMRVAYINEIARACAANSADIRDVQSLMSTDHRVGGNLLAGPGYGGACWQKDVPALCVAGKFSQQAGSVAANVEWSNRLRVRELRSAVVAYARMNRDEPLRVAVWGMAFKENTSDLRGSPAVDLVDWLTSERSNIQVSVYDPYAMRDVREKFGDRVRYGVDEIDACRGCDVLVVMNDFSNGRLRHWLADAAAAMSGGPLVLIDPRNLTNAEAAARAGFKYIQL